MARKIKCSEEVRAVIIDEVEQVVHSKLKNFLTSLYVEICQRKIFKVFTCEGCEMNWPSQRDHECCLKSEQVIFGCFYDDIKNEVSLETIRDICEQSAKVAGILMLSELTDFIDQLPCMSSHRVANLWIEMNRAVGENKKVYEHAMNICNFIKNPLELNWELFSWFMQYLKH